MPTSYLFCPQARKQLIKTIITKTTDKSQTNHRRVQKTRDYSQTSHGRLQTSHRQLQTSHRRLYTNHPESFFESIY